MQRFEYRVIPAPTKGEKSRTAKTTADRFAHGLTLLMNDLGRDGWEYVRADTLPCEERTGLTGKTMVFQHMLVFRRPIEVEEQIESLPAPVLEPLAEAAQRAPILVTAPEGAAPRVTPFPRVAAAPAPLGPATGGGHAAE